MADVKAPPSPSQSVPYPNERAEYPGGRQGVGYRWAFITFMVLFLLTVLAGLVNYLGSWLKYRVG
jgi:hypothetical protein